MALDGFEDRAVRLGRDLERIPRPVDVRIDDPPPALEQVVDAVDQLGASRGGVEQRVEATVVGEEGAAKRIDVLAAVVTAGMDVEQLVDLDLSYAPPFSSVWDPVAIAARNLLKAV